MAVKDTGRMGSRTLNGCQADWVNEGQGHWGNMSQVD